MLQQIKNKLTKPDKLIGVSLQIQPSGDLLLSYCLVAFKKEKAFVVQHGTLNSIDELANTIEDKSSPLVLSIDGKGILNKNYADDLINLLPVKQAAQLIPSLNVTDFYLQSYRDTTGGILSLVRKEQLTELVQNFKDKGFSLLACSLGNYNVLPFSSMLINLPTEELIGSEKVKVLLEMNPVVVIGESRISNIEFSAFALALGYFTEYLQSVDAVEFHALREEFIEKKFFTKLGIGVLGAMFGILLLNFIVLQYLAGVNKTLVEKQELIGDRSGELKSLEDNITKKEVFLKKVGWGEQERLAFYADKVGATVPSGLRLVSMQINPEDERKSKENRHLVIIPERITISGESSSAIIVNDWVKTFEAQEWVEFAKVESYQFDFKDKVGKFVVQLSVK